MRCHSLPGTERPVQLPFGPESVRPEPLAPDHTIRKRPLPTKGHGHLLLNLPAAQLRHLRRRQNPTHQLDPAHHPGNLHPSHPAAPPRNAESLSACTLERPYPDLSSQKRAFSSLKAPSSVCTRGVKQGVLNCGKRAYHYKNCAYHQSQR